ncbi:cupin-like domain-containing protein [Glaciecola siphonariae]|uniref:Cupin-like domain-containing protein n=1 Tax=Glaciecola siphonariae TaxID=521012 RepID=A0ABV9M094_9ALTE
MAFNTMTTWQISTIDASDTNVVPSTVVNSDSPVLLKGLVSQWPLVQKSMRSSNHAIDYLLSFYNGKTTLSCKGLGKDGGRFFYNDDVTKLNYTTSRMRIDDVLNAIRKGIESEAGGDNYYIPSNPANTHFPGFTDDHAIVIESDGQNDEARQGIVPNLWIGGKTIASCHYDVHKNIACCTTGKRKFTLFPPEQINNLYPGPFEVTPGGPVISMVDFAAPDFTKHPRFKDALSSAQEVELSPGDALYIPPLWWHHVEGLNPFNVLVNYWWDESPRYLGSPINALHDAMLSIRDRSEAEKQAWKHVFDYYIFGDAEQSHDHLPENAKGILAPLDENHARRLRSLIIDRLNK